MLIFSVGSTSNELSKYLAIKPCIFCVLFSYFEKEHIVAVLVNSYHIKTAFYQTCYSYERLCYIKC